MNSRPDTTDTTVRMRTMEVEGLNLFYREAGKPSRPKLVLLHGFPASSHQYRNLIPVLADTFHVLAMDYPGFGNSAMPDPATYPYTFDLKGARDLRRSLDLMKKRSSAKVTL